MDELDDALAKVRHELETVRRALEEAGRRRHAPLEESRRALESLDEESAKLEKHNHALDEKLAPLREQVRKLAASLAAAKAR